MTANHTLTPGTELVDEYGSTLTVDVIHEDGSLETTIVDANCPARRWETWSREEICEALREGSLRTSDGTGPDLVEEE
ncbi:hypothetical protein [Halalkalicoccus ordinarius]|uniref:hypothetical protein n=1 Tax=Halalkalicoccus ordinarius TaxID=3116651 RepID=UPI00300EEB19